MTGSHRFFLTLAIVALWTAPSNRSKILCAAFSNTALLGVGIRSERSTTTAPYFDSRHSEGSTKLFRDCGSRSFQTTANMKTRAKEADRNVPDNGNEQYGSRQNFVRGAAVALVGICSSAMLGGGKGEAGGDCAAWAVGVQPGERTTAPPNPLLLLPAMRAKFAVQNMLKLLKNPDSWDQAREVLKAPPLAPADFKNCFRTYSDADPEQHLAFDLYRIQAQEALKAVSELLAYLASEKAKGSEIVKEDVNDLDDAGQSVLQGIDDFLNLAPREDVLMVERNIEDQARTAAAKPSRNASRGRELEGAVAGEGAFVSGAWIER